MITKCKVVFINEISINIKEYFLLPTDKINFEPGQFLQLALDPVDSSIWPESRPFSIASYNRNDNLLRLIIRRTGKFTNRIFNSLLLNSIITIKLPYGDFIPPFDSSKILCIAGGSGIAPFLSFIDYYKENQKLYNLYLFHSTKYNEELIDKSILINYLNDHYKAFLTQDFSYNSIKRRIRISDITNLVEKNTPIYVCGSKQFNSYFHDELLKANYQKILVDNWT
jgi:NAD(P)H-flavin reductase